MTVIEEADTILMGIVVLLSIATLFVLVEIYFILTKKENVYIASRNTEPQELEPVPILRSTTMPITQHNQSPDAAPD